MWDCDRQSDMEDLRDFCSSESMGDSGAFCTICIN
jgi:hypothetical protein